MKPKLLVTAFGVVAACAVGAPASAQTCASPQAWQPDVLGETLVGDTCAGDNTATNPFCGSAHARPGPIYVVRSTFNAGRTFTSITTGGATATFNPVIYFTSAAGGCGANQETCTISGGDVPITSADVPDGDWLIMVSAADIDPDGACGTFQLISNGSFPVTLTNFTVS
jgi:hypothetical protein